MGLIAARGLRGLTHRAVDEAAGLPPGSTSYHARTRARLVEIALQHLADTEIRETGPAIQNLPAASRPEAIDMVAELSADFLHTAMVRDTEHTLARFELALEANRRPELRRTYNRIGSGLRETVTAVLRGLGSPAPERHARTMIAWMDGVLFDSLAGSGSADPPSRDELRVNAAAFLRALLRP